VSPALAGLCRPGYPVMLRVSLDAAQQELRPPNDGSAFDGQIDVVVEGIAYRQPVTLGAGAMATAEVVVTARSPLARASVLLRGRSGVLFRQDGLELRLPQAGEGIDSNRSDPQKPNSSEKGTDETRVVAVGVDADWVRRVVGGRAVIAPVRADEVPSSAAALLVADIVIVAGDGRTMPLGARTALADRAQEGGTLVFVLAADAPVHPDSLLSELGGCAGRPAAAQWLRAVAGSRRTSALGQGLVWQTGLGRVAAGTADAFPPGAIRAPRRPPDLWADPGIYGAFETPSWPLALRWRLVGGALAFLVVAAVLASVLSRGRRGAGLLATLGLSAGLAAIAWGLLLPNGRAVVEKVSVVECDEGLSAGARTDLLSVGGIGRSPAQVSLGKVDAVVPLYYSPDDAGAWRDVVIQRDAQGEFTVLCDVTKGVRRCFAGWRSWQGTGATEAGREAILVRGDRFAAGGAAAPPSKEAWLPLAQLKKWTEAERAVVQWQARRAAPRDRLAEASWSGAEERSTGPGALSWRVRPQLLWVEGPAE